jgi:hypothetical protein
MPVKIKKQIPQSQGLMDIDQARFMEWVDEQDGGTKEAILCVAEESYSAVELYLYCRFIGYTGSLLDLEQWFKTHHKKPDHRQMLLDEIDFMKEDISALRDAIENGSVKRDAGVARIAAMEKELRGTISQVESFTSNKDRKGLIMAGADRAVREILFIFKDDPMENALEEASLSAWARINSEN